MPRRRSSGPSDGSRSYSSFSRSERSKVAGVVAVAGHDGLAVGREGDAVAAERPQLLRQDRLAVGKVPDIQLPAVAARRDGLAVGRQGQAERVVHRWAYLPLLG